ncbi:hypothetical protein Gorai_007745, partial [Gossypium raimondii]|nr:hypothetical protein [Gossypium raimondii]
MIENLLNQQIFCPKDGLVRIEDGFTVAGGFVCGHNVGWGFQSDSRLENPSTLRNSKELED